MKRLPAEEVARLYPILVADLADESGRDFLLGVALANGIAHLPLVAAPVGSGTHELEIYTPGHVDPLLVLADPVGPPTNAGFPLRLRPRGSDGSPARPKEAPPPLTSGFVPQVQATSSPLAPARPSRHRISVRHAQELAGRKPQTTENPQALVGRKLASGKLELRSLIGEGAVGAVYRAWHRDLRIDVAVKVLLEDVQNDIEFCRRFHAEALAASRLDHMNLMRVFDFGQESDGLLYLAMEHLAGKPLGQTLVKGRPLSESRIADIMIQVCAGLGHAHARGVIHRDIKPDNLVLVPSRDDDGREFELVKVCDFGIALLDRDATASAPAGTPHYMSPEQCQGDAPLDGRSDVYACGVVLFQLATGELPFHAPTPVGLLNRHMNMPPPRPSSVNPDISERLEEIILTALEKEPDDRFAGVRELRNALRSLVEAPASLPRPPSLAPPAPRPAPAAPAQPLAPSGPRLAAPSSPDWLERGSLHPTAAPARTVSFEGRGIRALVDELAQRPSSWLAALVATTSAEQYDGQMKLLGWALPLLVDDGNFKSLYAIRCTLDMIVEHDDDATSRRSRAEALLQVLAEPPFLGRLATIALSETSPPREITELLLRAGIPATYALYSARLKMTNVSGVRARFVELVKAFGGLAMPMIRAGLAKLESKRELAIAEQLAVDLLDALPNVRDDAAGEIVARYLDAGGSPSMVGAAASSLVVLWGERASPLLLAILATGDAAARVASIRGLAELRCIDDRVVPKIVYAVHASASPAVRDAARAALSEVIGPARAAAERALADLGRS